MSFTEKKKRLSELKKIEFPSDQEIDEITLLEEEIAMEYNEFRYKEENPQVKEEIKEEPRMKRTIFEFVADKIREKQGKQVKDRKRDPKKQSIITKVIALTKEKPVTQAELDELKKQVIKYRLKADIAKHKEIIHKSKGGKMDTLNALFGDGDKGSKSSSRKSNGIDSLFWSQDDSKQRQKLIRDTLGHDKRDYGI